MALRLLRPATKSGPRYFYYVAAYWMLNILLVVAEARWHLIYQLTMWDIAKFKNLAPLFAQAVHPGAAPPTSPPF